MYSHLGGNILNDQNDDINKEVEKRKQFNYQICRLQQLSSCYETLINQERPHVPFELKVNESILTSIQKRNETSGICKCCIRGDIYPRRTPKTLVN